MEHQFTGRFDRQRVQRLGILGHEEKTSRNIEYGQESESSKWTCERKGKNRS